MKKLFKSAILLLTIVFALNACKQANKSEQNAKDDSMFIMEGFIEGLGTDKIFIQNWDGHRDSAQVTDGKFTLKTKLKDPCLSKLYLKKKPFFTMILAENTNYTLKGETGYNVECIVTGGVEQEYLNTFNQLEKKLSEKYQHYEMEMKLREKGLKKEEVTEISNKINEYYKELHKLQVKFIKENPKAHYSIELIEMFASGDSKEEIMNLLALIDPKHKKTIDYKNIQALLAEKRNDISLAKFMKGVKDVNYALDKNFTGKSFTDIAYMDIMPNNNLCALKKGGIVQIISPEGKKLDEFKAETKGFAKSIAVDQKNQIYIMDLLFSIEKVKKRGRVIEVKKTDGVKAVVYNSNGKKLREFMLAGLKTAPGAKISGDKLIVSDMTDDILGIYDIKDGKMLSKIEGLSSCCGILDFDVNNKNEIIVANLSAFRVNTYDLNGKIKLTFGNRGRDILDFHGCCNPVCVASLSNGAIVTAEKDPTRIKVYSKDGAKQIKGIDELVKGCTYIPMTVDSNDNLYLASPSKGIVKCVVTN